MLDRGERNLVTKVDLVDRAREMVPILLERAAEAEKMRRLHDKTQKAFLDAGFYKIFLPVRYGGYEMEFSTHSCPSFG